jgi:glycine cleavage system H protein
MDGFSYINIFETKGIEYIVIIIFLLSLIPFWLLLNKKEEINGDVKKVFSLLSEKIKHIPRGFFYSTNHTWAHLERSGIAKLGLDDILLHITGRIRINYLRSPAEIIRKGDLIAEVLQDGKKLKISSPISGKVIRFNPELLDNPELLHDDPYISGWIFMIEPSNWKSEAHACYLADEAKHWLSNESDRIRDFLAVRMVNDAGSLLPVTLQDGGELAESVLSHMPDDLWMDFQDEFLTHN